MRPLVALYKTFRGGEFMLASLESLDPWIDGIVTVEATRPWSGESRLKANCGSAIEAFQQEHPNVPFARIFHDCASQEESYEVGLATIRFTFGVDVNVLVVDSDEVWDFGLMQFKQDIQHWPEGVDAVRHRLWAYVKSPLYRVTPPETMPAVVCLKSAETPKAIDRRFSNLSHAIYAGCSLHHFAYVREDESEIAEKFAWNQVAERGRLNPRWLEDVWPKIPDVTDFHPICGERWKRVEVVKPSDLPLPIQRSFVAGMIAGRYPT